MAEALCGPSNPLQSFQKHTSVDRTLQQDRFVSRQSHSQGFRSDSGRNAGILDPEFEAFQAGHTAPLVPGDLLHQAPPSLRSPQAALPVIQQPNATGWASDFQRLHISQHPQHSPQQLVPHVNTTPWYQDFRQQQQAPTGPQQSFQSSYQPRFAGVSPFQSQQAVNFPYSSNTDSLLDSQWKGKDKQWVENERDKAAFDREFEALASEALREDAEQSDAISTELGGLESLSRWEERAAAKDVNAQHTTSTAEETLAMHDDLQQSRMETVWEEQATKQQTEDIKPMETEDDLANTAAELLDRVSDNTTQKFQESSFLALMRRLRDREVRVEGDQMVDVEDGKPIDEGDLAKAALIPPAEQDHDYGRDRKYTMAGALPPTDDDGRDLHGLDDGYGIHSTDPAALYGMHPVEDF